MTDHQRCRWQTFTDATAVQVAATQAVLRIAGEAIRRHGRFRIVLAGGSTPRAVYASLRDAITDWSAWEIWFGDERCLPPAHADRNSRMACAAWLDHVRIPRSQIHVIPAELGPDAAAAAYAGQLSHVDDFDLVLLGLGEDGHTASLFPGQDPGDRADSHDVLAVRGAPKPPPERVSLSAARLARTCELIYLVTGRSKQTAVADWRAGQPLPATMIRPRDGVDIFYSPA